MKVFKELESFGEDSAWYIINPIGQVPDLALMPSDTVHVMLQDFVIHLQRKLNWHIGIAEAVTFSPSLKAPPCYRILVFVRFSTGHLGIIMLRKLTIGISRFIIFQGIQ